MADENDGALSKEDAVIQVNSDFDRYLDEMREKQKKEKKGTFDDEYENMTFDEKLEELSRHPAFLKEIDLNKPLHPTTEALMVLKYEEEDPLGKARAYKEDGNQEFKKKKYKIAIANYTEAITAKCADRELNAVLYTNRAAAQCRLGNYRSAFHDCIFARKFKADHMKAILRGAECCMHMKRYQEVDHWTSAGLLLEPSNEKLVDMKIQAAKLFKILERDRRKEEAAERKYRAEELKLITEISSRGIQLAGLKIDEEKSKIDPTLLSNLEVPNPGNAKVHVNDDGHLVWPVIFMYPEHTQTDFIENFHENQSFDDHIMNMFHEEQEIPWDTDKKYKPGALMVYFEDREREVIYEVKTTSTLKQALQHKKYLVHDGMPCFILLVKDSTCHQNFISRNTVHPAS